MRPTTKWSVGRVLIRGIAAFGFLFAVLPLLVIVPMSFSSSTTLQFPPPGFSFHLYVAFFEDPTWLASARMSGYIGFFASTLATAVALPSAFALSRLNFRGRDLVRSFYLLPLFTPFVIVGVAAFAAYAPLGLTNRPLGLIVIHAAIGSPLALLAISAGLSQLDRRLDQAAASLGATPVRRFLRVTLPPLTPSILIGWLFAFVLSFDEVVVAIFVAGREATTLPKRMWEGIIIQVDPVVSVVATFMVLLTLLAFAASSLGGLVTRRRLVAATQGEQDRSAE